MHKHRRKPLLSFVTEGHFVAIPLAVPHDHLPIPADASRITALALGSNGSRLYGGTGGSACHVFVSIQKGACGNIVDLGCVPAARRIVALVESPYYDRTCEGIRIFAFAETDSGMLVQTFEFAPLYNTIQEPSYETPRTRVACRIKGWKRLTGVVTANGRMFCLSHDGVAVLSQRTGKCLRKVRLDGPHPVSPPLIASDGLLAWLAADGTLRRFSQAEGLLPDRRKRATLPAPVDCACIHGGTILTAHADGSLLQWNVATGAAAPIGRISPLPVQCLTVRQDGIVYGICGEGIGHLFRMRGDGTMADLGVIASVIGAIRHGFEFSCALTSPEGMLYLGEHDRGGHLWMYFPSYGSLT